MRARASLAGERAGKADAGRHARSLRPPGDGSGARGERAREPWVLSPGHSAPGHGSHIIVSPPSSTASTAYGKSEVPPNGEEGVGLLNTGATGGVGLIITGGAGG